MYDNVCLLNYNFEYVGQISWRRALSLLGRGTPAHPRVEVVLSSTVELRNGLFLPKILRLLKYVRKVFRARVTWTADRLKIRDDFRCQYCGEKLPPSELTVDHVLPKSRSGESTWENTVAACQPCNYLKANRLPSEAGMYFISQKAPVQPTVMEFFWSAIELLGYEKAAKIFSL